MKNIATALCVAAAIAAGTFVVAQAQNQPKSPPDPRIDKLLEQNEQILKNQDAIMKELTTVKEYVNWLRRRSS
jgi:hypothetical protein